MQTELALPHIQQLKWVTVRFRTKYIVTWPRKPNTGSSLAGHWSTPFTQIVKPSMAMSRFHVRVSTPD